jgi:UDP-N-acetylmuramoyl-tripeptide--D-alanyl-D-alanine ligase
MVRHYYYRIRFFLQVFQQLGYKRNEYRSWIKSNWDDKVLTREIGLMNVLLVALLYFGSDSITNSAIAVIVFIYSIFWFASVRKYKPEKVKKPLVFTARMKRLALPVFLLSFWIPIHLSFVAFTGVLPVLDLPANNFEPGVVMVDAMYLVFGWLLGTLLIPLFLYISALLTSPIEKRVHQGYIKQAKAKLASMPHLKVIAITGSYGKTSTKFMIRDLLKERFNVCVTPGSFNTPMGICKVINNDLTSDHQILVLEMGARYAGNIQELCDIAKPDISVITIVGLAHLETFGSQDVIAWEKGALVRNLDGGTAILNGDDHRVQAMKQYENDFSTIDAGIEQGDITASDISYGLFGSRFKVHVNDVGDEDFECRLLGQHNIQNLLLAVAVGHHLGMRLKTMAMAAKNIEPVEHRLELKQQGDVIIIDDAFNSNPVGARNAVDILSQFKTGRRTIITPGMIELGDLEEEENKKLGTYIAKAGLDRTVFVGKERTKALQEGYLEGGGDADKMMVVNSLFEANDLVFKDAVAGDVVLYENDLPDLYNE